MEVKIPTRLFTAEEITFSPASSAPDEDSSFEEFESALDDDFYIPPVGLREIQLLREGMKSPVKKSVQHSVPSSSHTTFQNNQNRGNTMTKELEEAQLALKSANQALTEAKETIEFQKQEILLAKEQYKRCQGEVEDLTIKNASMSKALSVETDLRRVNTEKIVRYDSLCDENVFYKKEIETLRAALTENLSITKVLQANEKLNKSKAATSEKQIEKLVFEKAVLQKEFDKIFLANENMKFLHTETSDRCEELLKKNEDLTQMMVGMATDIEIQFDEKTRKELEAFRNTIIKESTEAKEVVTTKWESKSRALQEQISALRAENSQLRTENISLSEEKQRLIMDHGFEMKTIEHKLNSTKEHVKNKSLQLSALGATFEERMSQLRRKEVENRMLYDQIDILKAAISKLENETGGFYLDKKSDKASEILEQVSSAVAAITV